MTILRWILTALVALAFLFFGTMKVTGAPASIFKEQKENFFDNYGINRTQIRLIGLLELFGGVAVLFWASQYGWLAQIGYLTLMCITAGAMYFHNRYDSVTKDGLPAIIQFALNASLLALSFVA